jgi:hypothetical protein
MYFSYTNPRFKLGNNIGILRCQRCGFQGEWFHHQRRDNAQKVIMVYPNLVNIQFENKIRKHVIEVWII